MELRQLRYFVAVAEELHFRRAAATLHVSQPPLSQQIQALETEMGCMLLKRTRRRVELTPSGETFLHDARLLLAGLDAAVASARRAAAGQSGRLRVDFVGSALLSVVPRIVYGFRDARPDVEVALRERPTVEVLRGVLDGTVDVGLVRAPIDETDDLRCVSVLRERTVAVLPATHPLADLRRVPLRRLAAEPLVLFPREQAPGFHDLLMQSLAASGTQPQVVQYAPETLTIIGLVAAGIGVSLGAESIARLALDGVTYRPLTGAPHAELLAVARSGDDSPLVAAFIAHAAGAGTASAKPAAVLERPPAGAGG